MRNLHPFCTFKRSIAISLEVRLKQIKFQALKHSGISTYLFIHSFIKNFKAKLSFCWTNENATKTEPSRQETRTKHCRFRKSKKKGTTNEQTKLATQKTVRFFWNFKNLLLILPPF